MEQDSLPRTDKPPAAASHPRKIVGEFICLSKTYVERRSLSISSSLGSITLLKRGGKSARRIMMG